MEAEHSCLSPLQDHMTSTSSSRVVYRVGEIKRVHSTCFYAILERVGWPRGNKATLPPTVQLEFSSAKDVPAIGSSVWLEATTIDDRRG